jgi:hypothetical protein
VNADYTIELPWGTGRHWLNNTGLLAQIFGGWSWSGSFVAQSGSPFTPRVTGNYVDVASGVNGTLRADHDGSDISVSDPTTLRYFNTAAFTVPAQGAFGNASRNLIIGPGSHNLNMNLAKNVNFGRTRGVNIRVQAPTCSAVQFSYRHVVNSPTFGRSRRSARAVVRLILRFSSDHAEPCQDRRLPFRACARARVLDRAAGDCSRPGAGAVGLASVSASRVRNGVRLIVNVVIARRQRQHRSQLKRETSWLKTTRGRRSAFDRRGAVEASWRLEAGTADPQAEAADRRTRHRMPRPWLCKPDRSS